MALISKGKPIGTTMTDPDASSSNLSPTSTPPTTTANPRGIPKSTLIFAGGITFFALSTLITRRSLIRRNRVSYPPFHTSAPYHKPKVNGGMEAVEALNIATINVTSVAMMVTGGGLWAFDINSIADMRRRVRGAIGVEDGGRGLTDKEAEEDIEEWLATVLSRKEEKEKRRGGDKSATGEKGNEEKSK